MNKIYQEKNSSQIMTAAFMIGFIIMIIVGYKSWSDIIQGPRTIVPFAISIILIVLLFYTFHSLSIGLYDDKLQFGFGIFKKTIKKGEINKIEKKEFKFRNYLGYGIRRGLDKSWGYVVGGEYGILIYLDNKKFFFNTEKPDELVQLIKQYLM